MGATFMSKRIKCLSIFMAASVLTGLVSSSSAFADINNGQKNEETNVVSCDDTYEIVTKDDSAALSDKDSAKTDKDDSYEVVTNKPVDIDDNQNPDNNTAEDSDEIVWEADAENVDDNYIMINNLKFLIRGDSVCMVGSSSPCDIEDLVLPDKIKAGDSYYTLESIYSDGLQNCKSLKNLVLPKYLDYMDAPALSSCKNLESISVNPLNEYYTCEDNILFTKDKSKLVLYLNKDNTNYTVPDEVKIIGNRAFSIPYEKCPLTDIKLSENVQEIGSDAFEGCKMESIFVPANVKTLGLGAFSGCPNLKNVSFAEDSKLTNISFLTFCNCTNLVNVSLPKNLESIGYGTFRDCSKLDNLVLPEGLTAIYDYAFEGCKSLSSIVIPSKVTYLGEGAFSGCSNLTDVEFDCDDLSTIKCDTFSGCTSLKTVKLPANLKTIESYAFYGCSALEDLEIPESTTDIADNAFAAYEFN